MKKPVLILLTLALLIFIAPLGYAQQKAMQQKEGDVKLKKGNYFDDDVFSVRVGKYVDATRKFFIDDFFEKLMICANVEIKNPTNKIMHCEYYVAFFDREGNLVGCASQGTMDDGLKAGEDTNFSSCLVFIPHSMFDKVTSYKLIFYESEVPIGKE